MYPEELDFLVSKVLFSNCQTTSPLGLWVTSKQWLYSLEQGLKNLDKRLWVLPQSSCALQVSTIVCTLVKPSLECARSANIGYAEKQSSGKPPCLSSVSLSPCQAVLANTWPTSAHAPLGVYESRPVCLKALCVLISFSFACYSNFV